MSDRQDAFNHSIRVLQALGRSYGGEGGSDADRAISESIRRIAEIRDNANEHGYLPPLILNAADSR